MVLAGFCWKCEFRNWWDVPGDNFRSVSCTGDSGSLGGGVLLQRALTLTSHYMCMNILIFFFFFFF